MLFSLLVALFGFLPLACVAVPQAPYLSENINEGASLELSDGSAYEVAPDDRAKAAYWIAPFSITIEKSDDPNYPLKLIDQQTKQAIKVKQTKQPRSARS